MGKASSSKKVARAARAGGKTTKGPKRQLGYPIGIAVIVVVGVLAVLFARTDNQEAAAVSPAVGEHWHAAYGIYVCDAFLPNLTDSRERHHRASTPTATAWPTCTRSTAPRPATTPRWRSGARPPASPSPTTGFTVNGTTYDDGFDCNGQPATVSLYVWPADDLSAAARDLHRRRHRRRSGSARTGSPITLAVVPPGTDVPRPPSVPRARPAHRRPRRHLHDHHGRGRPLGATDTTAGRHEPPRRRAPSEGGGPGRRVRDPSPPADLDDPQADAPDRRPAHDRAGRRRARGARRHRRRAVARATAPTPSWTPTPTGSAPASPCTTRSSPSRSTPPARCGFAAASAGIDDTFVVVNGDVLTDLDVSELWDVPPRAGRRGHHRPHPGRRPVPLRRRAHRRQGPGHRLRREARPRHRPHQLDQRRHLRARALGARAHPGRPQGLHRARDLPGDGRRRHAVRAHSDSYWVDAGTPNTYVEVQLDLIDGVRGAAEPAVHPGADIHPTPWSTTRSSWPA